MGKKTEYKRQFRQPSQMMQAEYQKNVQYCILRRQREHQHFFVEWDWESESENGSRPVLRSPIKNVNNSNSGDDSRRSCIRGDGIMENTRLEKEVQTPDWHRDDRSEENFQQADHRVNSVSNTPTLPARRSSEKKKLSSAHKRKSSPRTPPENGGKKPKPPFLAFGWADGSKGVGNKLTYNVRATNEVHPAATRAFKRRELDIEKAEERQKRETLKKRRMRALFNNPAFQVDDDIWLTEYQRNFSGTTPHR